MYFTVSLVNPKLNGADEDQIDTNQSRDQGAIMRNAVRQSYLKWPGGRIPYTISTQYTSFGFVFSNCLYSKIVEQ